MTLHLSIADFLEIAMSESELKTLPQTQKLYRELFNSAILVLASQLTIPDLADKLDCGQRTVQRYLKDLEKNGLIIKLSCSDQYGRPAANVYILSCFPNMVETGDQN